LGLTITKLLTEAMGGDIAVRSVPGSGSCFSVRLMLSPVPATKRTRDAARQPIAGYEGNRRTILVVDDDPNHVAFVRDALSELGFVVTAESNRARLPRCRGAVCTGRDFCSIFPWRAWTDGRRPKSFANPAPPECR